jgi:hypothetical protein
MPPSTTPLQSLTDSLIALKTQYERSLAEASTNASHLREQLSHVNALLLNQLLPSNRVVPQLTQSTADVPVVEAAIFQSSAQSLAALAAAEAPASAIPNHKASTREPKVATEPTPASGKRSTRPMLPAYRGLTRLEAIAQLLQTTPGQDVTTDRVSEGLFGKLSAADHKAERKSLNTQMYKGQTLKLWRKGTVRGTFLASASAPGKNAQPMTKASDTIVSKPKRPGRKPDPSKEQKPVAEVMEAKATHQEYASTPAQTTAATAKTEKLKLERKPAAVKAKTSQKVARSKKTELELVALLRKANIQV